MGSGKPFLKKRHLGRERSPGRRESCTVRGNTPSEGDELGTVNRFSKHTHIHMHKRKKERKIEYPIKCKFQINEIICDILILSKLFIVYLKFKFN